MLQGGRRHRLVSISVGMYVYKSGYKCGVKVDLVYGVGVRVRWRCVCVLEWDIWWGQEWWYGGVAVCINIQVYGRGGSQVCVARRVDVCRCRGRCAWSCHVGIGVEVRWCGSRRWGEWIYRQVSGQVGVCVGVGVSQSKHRHRLLGVDIGVRQGNV